MLFLQPKEVTFASQTWVDVSAVVVDRAASRVVREWDDTGPFVRFADVPERMVTVRVVQNITRGDLSAPALGSEGLLSFTTAPTAADAGRKRCTVNGIVTGVTYDLGRAGGGTRFGGALSAMGMSATRTITIVATSVNTQLDPVVLTDVNNLKEAA